MRILASPRFSGVPMLESFIIDADQMKIKLHGAIGVLVPGFLDTSSLSTTLDQHIFFFKDIGVPRSYFNRLPTPPALVISSRQGLKSVRRWNVSRSKCLCYDSANVAQMFICQIVW